MNTRSRIFLPLAATLLILLFTVMAFFPGDPGGDFLKEALGEDYRQIWDQYREQRVSEKQWQLTVFLGGLLLITSLLTLYFYLHFVAPIFRLSRFAAARDLRGLEGWTDAHGELGKMARLLARYLREGQMLQDEIRKGDLVVSDFERRHILEGGRLDREKLARDLHDGIIQSVYGVGLQIGALRNRLKRNGTAVSEAELQSMEKALREVVRDIRGLILDLEPRDLRERDLLMALRELGKSLVRIGQPQLELEGEAHELAGMERKLQIELYLVVRELIGNALKHAHPTRLRCSFRREGATLKLSFWNNGVTPRGGQSIRGSGLRNMEARLQPYRGSIKYEKPEDNEFAVDIVLPDLFKDAEQPITEPSNEENPSFHRR